MSRILIAGCGYVGTALGEQLTTEWDAVWGLRRRPLALPQAIRPIEADLAVPATLRELPPDLEVVVYAASPGGPDDALYRTAFVEGTRNLLAALVEQGQQPRRIFFVSSTAVYAQGRGEWVDEESPTRPEHSSGRRLLEGEVLLREGPFPVTVLRAGGIYGPRRQRLLELVRAGRAEHAPGPPRYTNRIHRDDLAGALRHLIRMPRPEDLYLAVDCEPVDQATLLRWMAGALGAPAPREVDAEQAKAFRSRGNKRCRNERLVGSGYRFRYPTFREGYAELIAGS